MGKKIVKLTEEKFKEIVKNQLIEFLMKLGIEE